VREEGFEVNMDEIATKIQGFSGREVEKLCLGLQAAVNGSKDSTLTQSLFEEVLDHHMKQKGTKEAWWLANPEKVREEMAKIVQ